MKNILIIGKSSFIAKNFIDDYKRNFKFFYFKRYFKKNDIDFAKVLNNFIIRNRIDIIFNFAADNNNSFETDNFEKILVSNYYLPLSIMSVANKLKTPLFLFLSKDMTHNEKIKNFYSLSKEMLRVYIENSSFNNKLRILNIDSLFGPHDLSNKRIFPSIFRKLYNKSKININIDQLKSFTYVKDLNKILFNLTNSKKKIIYRNVRSDVLNIKLIYDLLKKDYLKKYKNKNTKYRAIFLTSEWYKNYYGKDKS